MAGSKSDYTEKIVLDMLLGGVAFTPPDHMYLALSTAVYSDAATGSSMNEVSGANGYGRFGLANNTTNWPVATGNSPSTKTNGMAFTFAAATASWGTILSFYIVDQPSGGNVLYGGDLTTSKQILTGDTATFSQGAITVTED